MFPVIDAYTNKIKYVGRSKATVIDVRDPDKKGRIRVSHPIVGDTAWIPYLSTSSFFDPPSVGDVVYLEADCGDSTYCIAHGNINVTKAGVVDLPPSFQKATAPSNRGFHTPGGHLVELDDGEIANAPNPGTDKDFSTENRGIRITSLAGNKIHLLEDVDGGNEKILIETKTGDKIELDYKNNKLVIQTAGEIQVSASGDAKLTLKNGQVALGGAEELLDLVSQLADTVSAIANANSTETHPTAVGPSGPPTNASSYATAKSQADDIKSKVDSIKGVL